MMAVTHQTSIGNWATGCLLCTHTHTCAYETAIRIRNLFDWSSSSDARDNDHHAFEAIQGQGSPRNEQEKNKPHLP